MKAHDEDEENTSLAFKSVTVRTVFWSCSHSYGGDLAGLDNSIIIQ